MTGKKFSNLVSKTLGYSNAVAYGKSSSFSAWKLGYMFIEEEQDGTFLIANIKGHHSAKLIEAGFIGTLKIAEKKSALQGEPIAAIFWAAPAN